MREAWKRSFFTPMEGLRVAVSFLHVFIRSSDIYGRVTQLKTFRNVYNFSGAPRPTRANSLQMLEPEVFFFFFFVPAGFKILSSSSPPCPPR